MKPKRTILCVDDNEQSLSHRKIMLETRGYRVASYSRGEPAWNASSREVSTWWSPTWRCLEWMAAVDRRH